jgi:hypothetical protein
MTVVVLLWVAVAFVVGTGVPAGIWLSRHPQPKSRGDAAGVAVGLTCAACGHGHSLEETRRALYVGQRTLGDIHAAQRGRLGRRLARRAVTRTLMRNLWRN